MVDSIKSTMNALKAKKFGFVASRKILVIWLRKCHGLWLNKFWHIK